MKTTSAAVLSSFLLAFAASAATAPTAAKTEDFPSGNMAEAVKGMDSNNDGYVSQDEYLSYEGSRYDKDATQVATGNMTDAVKAERTSKRDAYLQQRGTQFGAYAKNSNGRVSTKDMVGYLQGPGSKQK